MHVLMNKEVAMKRKRYYLKHCAECNSLTFGLIGQDLCKYCMDNIRKEQNTKIKDGETFLQKIRIINIDKLTNKELFNLVIQEG